jgi:Mn-dependent DtxR family transcriptional regulator
MTVAAKDDELRRLADKSLDGQLLWELQNGFELSPRESQGVLEAVKLLYSERPEPQNEKVSLWVVKRDASVGKPLDELEKIQVWVTLHSGQEDLETYEAYGHAGLRRQKILRITEEILDQHGVATQEDLARLLGTSIRTVRRDIAYLLKQGQRVVTRGVYSDIGPSVSHKVVIVEMFLSGFVYTEICRKTQHSAKAVKRYVQTFGRVVALYERGLKEAAEIARYAGISERLAAEYLELYSKQRQKPGCQERIKDLLAQLPSRPPYPGADKTGMKKGVVGEDGR